MSQLALYGGKPVRERPFPQWPVATEREVDLLKEVLAGQQWGGYSEAVKQFEQVFAQVHDCEFGVAAANGSVAIEMALKAAGIGEGDEVIVPAHSFIATASAVNRVGATPVFVDIGRDTYNLNPELLQPAVSERTAAVIAVHFSGIMLDMDRFSETAAGLKLTVIEDAAHAHGAEWHGRRAGSFGICGTFSFQNSKSMTAGEGGMLITNDKDVAAAAAAFANCGRRAGHGWFEHFDLAPNYRLSGFQAAVLMAQLERLPAQIRTRQANRDALIGQVSAPGISFQTGPGGVSVRTNYLLLGRIDKKSFGMTRDDFVRAMEAEGIPCRAYYPHPLYKNPMYQSAACRVMPCPVAEQACLDSFWIPQNALMGDEEDTRDIARAIAKIWEAVQPVPGKVN